MKSYTDLEQSKKLSEFLSHESADGGWYGTTNQQAPNTTFWLGTKYSKNAVYPAWSLAALLDVLPEGTRLLKSATDDTYHCDCPKGNIDKWFDNSIDACYEMVIRLNELNLL